MKDHYPPSTKRRAPPPVTDHEPEFGHTREEYEDGIFLTVSYFSVVRFGVPSGSQCATTNSFPKALALAHDNDRALIYCINIAGRAFCIPKKQYEHFAVLWMSMRKG